MSIVKCWACGLEMTLAQRSAEDGFCPKCHSEINLDEPPYDLLEVAMEVKQSYQDKTSCNKCGGNNELTNAIIDDGIIYEVETKCKDCGFDDYWSHGFFHSIQDGFDNAKRIC